MLHHHRARPAAFQQVLRVGELRDNLHAAGGLVDDAAHLGHLSFVLVGCPVGQLQVNGRVFAYGVCHSAGGLRELEHLFLVHREVNLHRADVRHSGERLCAGAAHERPDLVGQRSDDTVRRALDVAEAQVLLCRHERGLCLRQLCLGTLVRVLCRLHLVGTYNLVGKQLLAVLVCQLGGVKLCRSRVHGGLGLAHGRLVSHVVDDEKQLAGLDGLAFLNTDFSNEPRHFRPDFHILYTPYHGRIG